MADGNSDFKYEDFPEISPVSKKYMVVKWINIVPCVPDVVMKNFEVSRCYYWEETKSVYLNDFPRELRLCDKDAVIFGSVARNSKFRMWFKCIADPKMICTERIWGGEEGELQEEMGQAGYLAIRIQNDWEKINICQNHYEHL